MSDPYLEPGTTLRGRWTIVRELGRGGYSVVYLARDLEIDGDVAVKLLVPPPAAARVARERMRREVQVMRTLSHESIVAVYDFVEEGPWSFIVMEYVAGPDLQVRVAERGPLAPDQVVRLGRDIAAALGTAHHRGILHRDVKPQNVLLDPDGRFRLTDFGSARLDGQASVTTTGALAGTPDYTAPEILAGGRGDARADVYALGLTLYFALTGGLPTKSERSLVRTIGAGPRLGEATGGASEWLGAVIARATSPEAEVRYPTVSALDEALARAGDSPPTPLPRCVLCAGPDPLGVGLCPSCGGAGGAGDTLVFLGPRRESAAEIERRLAEVLPAVAGRVREAVRGEQPLFSARRGGVDRLVEELGRRGLPARSVARSRVVTCLPAGFWLMLGAVVLTGAAAGQAAAPSLQWITPMFAGLLLLSACRTAASPLVAASPTSADGLPVAVERELITTLAALPPGTARNLLADITRTSRALHAKLRRTGDLESSVEVVGQLLRASCTAAADLAQLDESLARFEQQRARLAALPEGWLDALGRCGRARDALVQRLLEALAVLGRLQGQAADLSAARSDMGESIAELRTEADARAAAAEEITELLRDGGTAPHPAAR